jgi:glycosyltransferase 2 family protein
VSTGRSFWILIRIIIAVGILYYLFINIPYQEVVVSLLSANLEYLIPSLLIIILGHLIVGLRLKLLTDGQGMSLSIYQIFKINISTTFYRLFLPGAFSASAVRFYKLSSFDKKRAETLAALAVDRMINVIALCMVGLIFWLLYLPSDSNYIALSMSLILSGLIFSGFIIYFHKGAGTAVKILDALNIDYIASRVKKVFFALNRFGNLSLRSVSIIFTVSIIMQMLGIGVYCLLAKSLGIEVSFLAMGWIRCVVVLISMIPISIAGLGIREGSFILLFRPFGILDEEALAFSLLVFTVNVVLVGLIGGLIEGKNLFLSKFSR